jgi:hypothetical protein
MTRHRSSPIDDRARQLRRAARRQTLAAVFLTACSLFSPAPDLRPKPLLPVKYQLVKPADPPGPGSDKFVWGEAGTLDEAVADLADADADADADALTHMNGVAPHITTRLIAGAGHDPTLVKAAEVQRAVLDFLVPSNK